ncbi:MAG: MFS transporter [Anaerolineae bacterium]
MAGPPVAGAGPDPLGRRNRRLLWLDGTVSNISESFVTNYVSPFAIALGATNSEVGLLSSLTNLAAALGLLPGARLADQTAGRKRVVLWSGGGVSRLILLLIALAPLLLPPPLAVTVYIGLIALRGFVGQLGYPAWTGLMADLVPEPIRGRYFSSRSIAMSLVGLLCVPLAGRLIDLIGPPIGYQASFLIAGLIGFVATAIYAGIVEPPAGAPRQETAEGEAHGLRTLFERHPRFVAFTAVAFFFNMAVTIAGPYFTVHLVRNLGATPTEIGILAVITSLSTIVGQRVWGRVNDRRGPTWVMFICGLQIPAYPLLWIIAPAPWFVGVIYTFSGFAWAGYSLASFNLLLSLTPQLHRGRFVAAYQMAAFLAAALGPLIGSALLSAFSIRAVFAVSAVGRLLAALLFVATVKRTA